MKTEISRNQQAERNENSGYSTRGYYFHPDEDFREDFDWGKTSSAEPAESES